MKPDNLMLNFDDNGSLVLVDFGFAKILDPNTANKNKKGVSKTFTKCGTPGYIAPEIIQ